MTTTSEDVARSLLEVVPIVMKEIRSEMRSRRAPDLTVPQFRALAFVDRNAGASLANVASHMGLTPPSVSRLIDGLMVRGLITREDRPEDRRRVKLAVTDQGVNVLENSRRGTLNYLAGKLEKTNVIDRDGIINAMETIRSIFAIDSVSLAMGK